MITYMHYWKVRMLSPVLTNRPENRVCDGSLIYSQVGNGKPTREKGIRLQAGTNAEDERSNRGTGSNPVLTTKGS